MEVRSFFFGERKFKDRKSSVGFSYAVVRRKGRVGRRLRLKCNFDSWAIGPTFDSHLERVTFSMENVLWLACLV